MIAAHAIAVTLGTLATVAGANDGMPASKVQDFLDRGFEVIAEGQLINGFQCDPELAGITLQEIRQGPRCSSGEVLYGAFKRLKGRGGEFVCVSSRDWACYATQSSS